MFKVQIGILSGVVLSVFIVLSIFLEVFMAIVICVVLAIILFVLYTTILWKYDPLVRIPVIQGQYEGILNYSFEGEKSKKIILQIEQTLLRGIIINGHTDKAHYQTSICNLAKVNDAWCLQYIFYSESYLEDKDNPNHYGAGNIKVIGGKLTEGEYWTSRQTVGTLIFNEDKKPTKE